MQAVLLYDPVFDKIDNNYDINYCKILCFANDFSGYDDIMHDCMASILMHCPFKTIIQSGLMTYTKLYVENGCYMCKLMSESLHSLYLLIF